MCSSAFWILPDMFQDDSEFMLKEKFTGNIAKLDTTNKLLNLYL